MELQAFTAKISAEKKKVEILSPKLGEFRTTKTTRKFGS